MTQIIFTRYLYIKDEVELSLITSILTHNNRSLFWAYELYYSGFKEELFALLWKIYYDFFASLNPSFWEFMIKKEKEKDQVKAIASIVNNLLIRPANLDYFILRQSIKQNKIVEVPIPKESGFLECWLKEKDIESISIYIVKTCPLNALQLTLDKILTFFNYSPSKLCLLQKKWAKAIHCCRIDPRTHLLTILLNVLATQSKIPLGKNLYLIVEDNEITQYNTIEINPELDKARKILSRACIYPIDENDYLSLFSLVRNGLTTPLTTLYYYHWEYFASFSPVWAERLARYKGCIIDETQKVDFKEDYSGSDDNQQAFYERYGYEPDEQAREIQQKNIQYIQNLRTWESLYQAFINNGVYQCKDISSWTTISY